MCAHVHGVCAHMLLARMSSSFLVQSCVRCEHDQDRCNPLTALTAIGAKGAHLTCPAACLPLPLLPPQRHPPQPWLPLAMQEERMTPQRKRQAMLLLEAALHGTRCAFNAKFMALRDVKKKARGGVEGRGQEQGGLGRGQGGRGALCRDSP